MDVRNERPVAIPADINWNSLDKKSFYFYNAIFFFMTRTIQHPTMLIKTRLQAQQIVTKKSPNVKADLVYKGMIDAFSKIFKREGPTGLYKGFLTNTIGILPSQFVYMTTYEFARAHIPQHDPSSSFSYFAAGGIASLCSSTLTIPLDVISQRLMVQDGNINQYQYKGGLSALSQIVRTEGVRGLYRGYVATICTYAPHSAIWWGTYSTVKENLYIFKSRSSEDSLWKGDVFVAPTSGVAAGIVASTTTNPLDVAKTRLQVLRSEQSKNMFTVLRDLVREEGWKSLFRGVQARVWTSTIMSLLLSTSYESVKKLSINTT